MLVDAKRCGTPSVLGQREECGAQDDRAAEPESRDREPIASQEVGAEKHRPTRCRKQTGAGRCRDRIEVHAGGRPGTRQAAEREIGRDQAAENHQVCDEEEEESEDERVRTKREVARAHRAADTLRGASLDVLHWRDRSCFIANSRTLANEKAEAKDNERTANEHQSERHARQKNGTAQDAGGAGGGDDRPVTLKRKGSEFFAG